MIFVAVADVTLFSHFLLIIVQLIAVVVIIILISLFFLFPLRWSPHPPEPKSGVRRRYAPPPPPPRQQPPRRSRLTLPFASLLPLSMRLFETLGQILGHLR